MPNFISIGSGVLILCGGSNFWFSHRKEKSPLTHGLNYRSACDISWKTLFDGARAQRRLQHPLF